MTDHCMLLIFLLSTVIVSSQGNPLHMWQVLSPCVALPHVQQVVPLLETVATVTGCSSQKVTSKSQEVRVVSLASTGYTALPTSDYLPKVTMRVKPRIPHSTHAGLLVVVLHADRPVMWHLDVERLANSSRFTVLVTNNSSQLVSSTDLPLTVVRKRHLVPLKTPTWVRRRYGAITSYARVDRANDITLYVGIDDTLPKVCNVSSTLSVGDVSATYVRPQPALRCQTGHNMEIRDKMVHVIELLASGSNEVVVHLQPYGDHEAKRSDSHVVWRDLVLVLKCHVPVEWRIESWGIGGSLKIMAENKVVGGSLAKYHTLSVQAGVLPDNLEDLIAVVQSNYGSLVTITRVEKASSFNVFVDSIGESRNIQSDSTFPAGEMAGDRVDGIPDGTFEPSPKPLQLMQSVQRLFPAGKFQNEIQKVLGARDQSLHTFVMMKSGETSNQDHWKKPNFQLASYLTLKCLENGIMASFPKHAVLEVLKRLDLESSKVQLTLRDEKCAATQNDTHYILRSSLQSCNAKLETEDDETTYFNQVLVWVHKPQTVESTTVNASTDDDLLSSDGSGTDPVRTTVSWKAGSSDELLLLPLDFQCVYNVSKSGRNGRITYGVTHPHVFKMKLFRDKDYSQPFLQSSSPVTLFPQDHVYVQTSIEAGPHLNIVTEECWLSKKNDSNTDTLTKTVLIYNSCARDPSVEMLETESRIEGSSVQRFSFQLSTDLVHQTVYLLCRLSGCSTELQLQLMGINKCTDLKEFCTGLSLKPYLDWPLSKHDSVEVSCPLLILPMPLSDKANAIRSHAPVILTHGTKTAMHRPSSSGRTHGMDLITQQVVVGLPTEAVVGIAFASFVIGAGLTGILWFIHAKTDPARMGRAQQPSIPSHPTHRHYSGYDLSGHSGSSTPSSQAPVAAHACS